MPVNKESKIVSNKEARADEQKTAQSRANIEREAAKAQEEQSKKLDKKFGSDGTASDKEKTIERQKAISKLLRDSIKKSDDAQRDLQEFSLALQEKRADLPNKRVLTVEEFNDWMNDLNMILQERDRLATSAEDTLAYVIEKIRHDSIA